MNAALDHIDIEQFSPFGPASYVVLDAAEAGSEAYDAAQAVIIGVDRSGALPIINESHCDVLVTTAANPPRPWISVSPDRLDKQLDTFKAAIQGAPYAAAILRRVLRINEALPFTEGLAVESLAYSTLLGGGEFRQWRRRTPGGNSGKTGNVSLERDKDHLTITLAQPDTRNTLSATMRDALYEALATALDDPTKPLVTLRGAGACFSVGGDLDEFGVNRDLAQAHAIRTMRSVTRLIYELGERMDVMLHSACIGSGIEIAAAAAHRAACEKAFFQLPEIKMGLIPGAGGTVSLPRAIGRHRACAMMLTGMRISARTAKDWGLIHKILPRS